MTASQRVWAVGYEYFSARLVSGFQTQEASSVADRHAQVFLLLYYSRYRSYKVLEP